MPTPPVDPSELPEDLPAGVPEESLPDGMTDPTWTRDQRGKSGAHGPGTRHDNATQPGQTSHWWPTFGKTEAGDETGTPANGARSRRGARMRTTTGTEELEAFKPVPLLGHLPWKTQHLLSTLALLFALSILLFVSTSAVSQLKKRAGGMEDSAVSVLVQATSSALSGTPGPSPQALSAAQSRILAVGGQQVRPTLDQIGKVQASAEQLAQTRQTAKEVSQSLSAAITSMATHWRTAGGQGQWASPDAVNFAQALAEVRYLQEVTASIGQGHPRMMDNRFPVARQNVEQAIRTFAQAPTSNGPLLEAWRALASGWAANSGNLDVLLGQRQNWNGAVAAHQAALELQGKVLASGGRLALPPEPEPSWVAHAPLAIVLSGLAVALALCFLTWVGWKQQRWQALTEMASAEQVGIALDRIVSQLRRYRPGHPVKISNSIPMFEPLVEAARQALDQSQRAHVALIEHAHTLARDALASSEATGNLVDLARQGQEGAMEAGEDVLAVTQALQAILTQARTALSVVGEEASLDDTGAAALSAAVASLEKIEARSREQETRFQRLSGDARQVQEAARGIGEEADRLAVLAIQAAIQAARAGEAGQGFRIIAEHLKELSERLASSARRTGAGTEALLIDLEAALRVEGDVLNETSVVRHHQEVAQEWALAHEQKFDALREGLTKIMEQAAGQEDVVDRLADRTSDEMKRLEAFRQVGQMAAEAASILASTAATLETSMTSKV